jgi:hypothetical protein
MGPYRAVSGVVQTIEDVSAKRLPRYTREFKLKAVRLTRVSGMEVQAVAEALDIHPLICRGGGRKRGRDACVAGCPGRVSRRRWCEKSSVSRIWSEPIDCFRRSMSSEKGGPVLFRKKADIFAFIEGQRQFFKVSRLCALYRVTRAG